MIMEGRPAYWIMVVGHGVPPLDRVSVGCADRLIDAASVTHVLVCSTDHAHQGHSP
jgi:hypothetical protein